MKIKAKKKPSWLKIAIQSNKGFNRVNHILNTLELNTVCQAANCPNRHECFSKETATFLIMGEVCTRGCTFCNIKRFIPSKLDPDEPKRVAKGVAELGLKHAVITSVTRDDLPDGGSSHFSSVIKEIRKISSGTTIEVLIPDLQGVEQNIDTVINANPEVINHNIETVPSLYSRVRPQADYQRSLNVLERVKKKNKKIKTKSGIMLGLGEQEEELIQSLKDLREVKCDFLTVGQYLQPSFKHHPVVDYVKPEFFDYIKNRALELGFLAVSSSPFTRSSYNAHDMLVF